MRSLEEIEILFLSNLLMIGAIFFSISFIESALKIFNLRSLEKYKKFEAKKAIMRLLNRKAEV